MTETAPRRRRRSAWWALVGVVTAPALAAVAVGLAAAVLPPRPYGWAQLAASGLPYAAWALAALAGVWLLGGRWKVALGLLLPVLLVGLRAGVPGRFAAPAPAEGDLVVTTFNVPQVGPSREALGDSVVGYVGRTAPDLLLMQDARVTGENERRRLGPEAVQVEAVRTRLPYALTLPARLAGHPGWQANTTDIPFFVRRDGPVEVVEQEILVLGVERDPDVSLALRSELVWRGRRLVLYNVHLRSFGYMKPWEDPEVRVLRPSTWAPYLRRYRGVYAQRGDEAAEIAERIAQETLPVVVAGDFNSTPDNWSYRRLRTAGGVDRADAAQAAGGWAWGRTYHSARPLVRIDFVLVDPALEVTSVETAPVGFSDHRPVRVTLRWRDGG